MPWTSGGRPWNKIDLTTEQSVEIRRFYIEERYDFETVAKKLGLSRSRVLREIHEKGLLKTRSRSKRDACIHGKYVGNGVDVEFLRTWTPDSAWVWGVWFGDGWLSKNGEFGFSGDDQVMFRVKELIKTEAAPYRAKKRKKKNQNWRLGVRSVRVEELILAKFDLNPGRKSRLIRWPIDLPRELERDFLRGCWDADGCWMGNKVHREYKSGPRDYIYLKGIYASTSREFVEAIRDCLTRNCAVTHKNVLFAKRKEKDAWCWIVQYSRDDSEKIGKWLYEETEPLNRSDRKFQNWSTSLEISSRREVHSG